MEPQKPEAQRPPIVQDAEILRRLNRRAGQENAERTHNLVTQGAGIAGLGAGWFGVRQWLSNRLFNYNAFISKDTAENLRNARQSFMDAGAIPGLAGDGTHAGGVFREAAEYKAMLGEEAWNNLKVSAEEHRLVNRIRRVGGPGVVSTVAGIATGLLAWAGAKMLFPRKEPEAVMARAVGIPSDPASPEKGGESWAERLQKARSEPEKQAEPAR